MINTIIKSDDAIGICFDISPVDKGYAKNTFTITGSNTGIVNYNPNSSHVAEVVDDSSGKREFIREEMSTTISLGHELVHAYRFVTGQNVEVLVQETGYKGVVPAGTPIIEGMAYGYSDELETVGLVQWSKGNSSAVLQKMI